MLGNSAVIMVNVFPGCGHAILTWIAKMHRMNMAVVFSILCCPASLAESLHRFGKIILVLLSFWQKLLFPYCFLLFIISDCHSVILVV